MYMKPNVEWFTGCDVEATCSHCTGATGVMFEGTSVTDTELPGAPHEGKYLKDCIALKVCLGP